MQNPARKVHLSNVYGVGKLTGGRLLERDFVVTQIRGRLLRIPRELHTLILRGTSLPYV